MCTPTCLVAHSCLTLCGPMNCSPPDSAVHGIFSPKYWSWVPFLIPGDLLDSYRLKLLQWSQLLARKSTIASFVVASPHFVVLILVLGKRKEEYASVREGDLALWSLFRKEKKDVWTLSVFVFCFAFFFNIAWSRTIVIHKTHYLGSSRTFISGEEGNTGIWL